MTACRCREHSQNGSSERPQMATASEIAGLQPGALGGRLGLGLRLAGGAKAQPHAQLPLVRLFGVLTDPAHGCSHLDRREEGALRSPRRCQLQSVFP